MKYYSTKYNSPIVSFEEALFNGLAPDGGLYLPEFFPNIWQKINNSQIIFPELASIILTEFIGNEIPKSDLNRIAENAFNFNLFCKDLKNEKYILELFHGPTFAFKDFAARFMSHTLNYFLEKKNLKITILVATSGDTGSAVANAFYKIDNINVVVLFPKNRVSKFQELQISTLGSNITAIEIDGTFDDCQELVKNSFKDKFLNDKLKLTSANSINIARLLPQICYYFWGANNFSNSSEIIFSVPSGNFGNLTAGLIAKQMGLPIKTFIAATNSNDVIPKYLNTGIYNPKSSIQTISNAMDVGSPSNFERIQAIYKNNLNSIKNDLVGYSFNDAETIEIIRNTFSRTNYILDPHTAVGLSALNKYRNETNSKSVGIVLGTAHPIKFSETIKPIINSEIHQPESLTEILSKKSSKIYLQNSFTELKNYLLQIN